MIAIKNVHELTKILYTYLVKESELDNKKVLNALSVYGIDLVKYMEDLNINSSLDLSDLMIIFELQSRNNSSDVAFEDNNGIYSYVSYTLHLTIYGNSSNQLAHILKNRFESEIVRNNLLNEGIHIENIDNPSDYNEFINKTMWIRSNLNINLTCLYKIKNIDSYSEYESISNINII